MKNNRTWKKLNILAAIGLISVICMAAIPAQMAYAATTTVTVVAPEQVNPDEQFSVSVEVTPGTQIAGVQLYLSFTPSVVKIDSIAEGNLLSQNGASTYLYKGAIDNSAGTVSGIIGAIITPGESVSTAGTFVTVSMTAVGSGTAYITLSSVVVGDINGQPVPVTVTNDQTIVGSTDGGVVGGGGGGGGGGGVAPTPTPPPDTTAPRLSAITSANITEHSAEITWTTNEDSTSQVEYEASEPKVSPLDETLVTNHHISLNGLKSNTTYSYKVISADGANNTAVSGIFEFVTAPALANIRVSNLQITPAEASAGEEITITATVSNTGDLSGSYEVEFKVDGVIEDTKMVPELDGGGEVQLSFTTIRSSEGTFSVNVNDAEGSFTIEKNQTLGPIVEENHSETNTPEINSDVPAEPEESASTAKEPDKTPSSFPWLGIIIGAISVIVVAVPVFLVIRHRRYGYIF